MTAVERSLNLETAEWTITFPANLPCGSEDWLRDLVSAAPIIEAAMRERVASEIEAARATVATADSVRVIPWRAFERDVILGVYTIAARIARGQS